MSPVMLGRFVVQYKMHDLLSRNHFNSTSDDSHLTLQLDVSLFCASLLLLRPHHFYLKSASRSTSFSNSSILKGEHKCQILGEALADTPPRGDLHLLWIPIAIYCDLFYGSHSFLHHLMVAQLLGLVVKQVDSGGGFSGSKPWFGHLLCGFGHINQAFYVSASSSMRWDDN